MAQGKPKQFARPSKKPKPKTSEPVTADDFQELADFEEEAGGKWRAGDPAKSGRAFLRALEIYDKGLAKHPKNFDLAYNKARLQFEITQNPTLVEAIAGDGEGVEGMLREALDSHRVALGLDGENCDVLFNTSQVLASLAEIFEEGDLDEEAAGMLREGLELLSVCLGRQEMLMEQQRVDFEAREEGEEEGGVSVGAESSSRDGSVAGSEVGEQSATIVNPITPGDLLDTVQASLSALTNLVPLVDASEIGALGDMAQSLTEAKAPSYIALLPADAQDAARFSTGLARAIFIASFADAQFSAQMIELKTYTERLQAFEMPGKDQDVHALFSEAQARSELVHSALDQADNTGIFDISACWKQLTTGQDLLTKASKLTTDDAKERRAKIYDSKADIELLRWRLATGPYPGLSDAVKKSGPTLLANARTFYKGAADHGRALGEGEIVEKGIVRFALVNEMVRLSSEGAGSSSSAPAASAVSLGVEMLDVVGALEMCVDEGLIDSNMGNELMGKLLKA